METETYRKIARRVIAPLGALIVLSSIDRVNVSFAAAPMRSDIGLDPVAYGVGVGLFFAGYLLCQLPSAAVLRRIGPRRWIAASVVGWGAAASSMAFVHSPLEFGVLRFLLGMFESGFAPGVVWYLGQWLPQAFRARAIGLTLLAIPVSVVVGGPLCGALLSLGGPVASWRLMFLAEGLVTVAAGFAALGWFVDRPAQARWLAQSERDAIEAATGAERAAAAVPPDEPLPRTLANPLLWLAAAVWLALITGSNAIIFWLPVAIRTLGPVDPLLVGSLSALPWIAIGIGMVANARHSDRSGERYRHIGLPIVWAAAMFAGTALAIGNGPLALVLLVLGGFGIGGAQSVFWAVPTRFLAGRHPAGIATINLCGNISGLVAPAAIGAVVARTGRLDLPVYALAALLLAGAAATFVMRGCDPAR